MAAQPSPLSIDFLHHVWLLSTMSYLICSTRSPTRSMPTDSSLEAILTLAAQTRQLYVMSILRCWMPRSSSTRRHRYTPNIHRSQSTQRFHGQWSVEAISQVAVVSTHGFSDHNLVSWSWTSQAKLPRRFITYRFRNLKSVDRTLFKDDKDGTENDFAIQLNQTVTAILDGHCPI